MTNFKTLPIKEDKRRQKRLQTKTNGFAANTYADGYEAGLQAKTILANSATRPTSTSVPNVNANRSVCNIGDMMKGDDGTMCHAISAKGIRLLYCWSHGLGRNPKHTSELCNNPLDGHKKEATLDNMMGGNNNIASRHRRSQTNTESKKE